MGFLVGSSRYSDLSGALYPLLKPIPFEYYDMIRVAGSTRCSKRQRSITMMCSRSVDGG